MKVFLCNFYPPYPSPYMPILSIVIPCFNESTAIYDNYIKACCLGDLYPIEFIIVNNGSVDDTEIVISKLATLQHPSIKFITLKTNCGYGNGIKEGLKHCNGAYIGWTHGDGQTNLLDIERAFLLLIEHADRQVIKGSRVNRPFLDRIISGGLDLIISILFLRNIKEINAQPSIYKIQNKDIFASFSNDLAFDMDAYISYKMSDAREIRFNVEFPARKFGSSSWNRGALSKIYFIALMLIHVIRLRVDYWRRLYKSLPS